MSPNGRWPLVWLLGAPFLVFSLLMVLPFLSVGLPTWVLIVPILGFLIFIHEFGHFITAKRFGITVHEFGFGFPPRIFGIKYGETTYTVNWIPLGGFVRMEGEDGRSSDSDVDPSTDQHSFANQSILLRFDFRTDGSVIGPGVYVDDIVITD